jgi:glycolate oxidase iron-sulfur subunit
MSLPLPVTKPHESSLELDPRTYKRGLSCVHCGLCLPACPTYTQTLNEADSPRGRIQLMLGLADGKIEASESAKHHLDLCLDCRACETACPSGVVYHELIEETRARLLKQARHSPVDRFMQWMFFNVFVYPTRLKLVLLPARLMQKIGLYSLLRKLGLFKLLPAQLRKMEQMLPATGALWPRALPPQTAASERSEDPHSAGSRKHLTISFLPGCIGSVMFESVNRKAVELLSCCGATVLVPPTNVCCGAIHHHDGATETAEEFARKNIDAYLPKSGPVPDYIVTTIAGCGAMLKDYDVLLRDDPEYRDRAKIFASKVRDISQVLLELGLPKLQHPINERATYHDACHLAHAQRVTSEPRKLLAQIPGLTMIALPESDMCCGAAGTYNLEHPEMATDLAERKLKNIESTSAAICVTGNVGCAMHIQSQADALGRKIQVLHPVELLHRAVFSER